MTVRDHWKTLIFNENPLFQWSRAFFSPFNLKILAAIKIEAHDELKVISSIMRFFNYAHQCRMSLVQTLPSPKSNTRTVPMLPSFPHNHPNHLFHKHWHDFEGAFGV
jgi:hypothetical protein